MSKLTFAALCRLEPRLKRLYTDAKAVKDDRSRPSFCANDVWYGDGLKDRLCQLVGWEVRHRTGTHPELATSEAYDVAYETIYDRLPNCRNCLCA